MRWWPPWDARIRYRPRPLPRAPDGTDALSRRIRPRTVTEPSRVRCRHVAPCHRALRSGTGGRVDRNGAWFRALERGWTPRPEGLHDDLPRVPTGECGRREDGAGVEGEW